VSVVLCFEEAKTAMTFVDKNANHVRLHQIKPSPHIRCKVRRVTSFLKLLGLLALALPKFLLHLFAFGVD